MTNENEVCKSCMRSPAQHPSRLGATGGLDLDLGLAASPPPPAHARVSSHQSRSRAESKPIPVPEPRRGGPALALELDAGPASSRPPVSSGPQRRPIASGRGIMPGPTDAPAHATPASIPSAPEGKPGLFSSGAPRSSDAPPPSDPPPRSHRAPSSGPTAPGGGAGNLFGSDDDEEWDAAGALSVGLDYGSEFPPPMSQPAPVSQRQPGPSAGVELADPAPSAPVARAPMTSHAPTSGRAPVAAAVGGGQPLFSAQEIEAVAQYGPVPSNPLLAPLYALRVFQRRRALGELLVLQKRTHEQATMTLRGKLADIADVVIARAPDELAGVVGPIRAAEQKISDRKAQLEAASGQFASQFKSLQDELDAEAKKRQQLDRDRNMAQIKVEDAAHKRAHVAGELKRVNVAVEAAHEAARKAAGSDASFAPPEHARRITALEADKAKLVEQVRARDKAVADANAELRDRDQTIKALEARVNAIHARQAKMEAESGQAQSLGLDSLKAAQQERLIAYEVAIDTIMAQAKSHIDKPTKAQIDDVKRQLAVCDADLEKQTLALNAFDDAAYKRGIAIVLVVAVVLLVVLISVARVQ